MKLKQIAIATVLSLGVMGSAVADGGALFAGKGCSACHGADAKTPIMPAYPKLAGQNAEYTATQLRDIKSGKRNNGMSALMVGIMAGVSEEEITAIAQWLSEQ